MIFGPGFCSVQLLNMNMKQQHVIEPCDVGEGDKHKALSQTENFSAVCTVTRQRKEGDQDPALLQPL